MNQKEEEKQAKTTAGKFNFQFLRRTLQFAISASLVSLCLWYSTGCYIIPHSLNFCFSTFLFSIFTRTLERKYMFLVCNGILAFLARSSLCNSSVMSVTGDHEFSSLDASETGDIVSRNVIKLPAGKSNIDESHNENVILAAEDDLEQVQTEGCQADDEKPEAKEHEDIALNVKMEDSESEDYSEAQMWQREEEEVREQEKQEEGPDDEVAVLMTEDDGNSESTTATTTAIEEYASTDELNRKFEEFIRKMKEEIRVEAQKQVVVV